MTYGLKLKSAEVVFNMYTKKKRINFIIFQNYFVTARM